MINYGKFAHNTKCELKRQSVNLWTDWFSSDSSLNSVTIFLANWSVLRRNWKIKTADKCHVIHEHK